MNTIAERLKYARELREMTQEELAAKAGVSQGTIGNIESGARRRPREIIKIAKALRVRPDWLQDGIGQMDEAEAPSNVASMHLSELTPYTVNLYSATKFVRAPAVEWARLETDLSKGLEQFSESDYFEFMRTRSHSDNVRLVMVQDDSLGPRVRRGDFLAFDLENKTPDRNQVVLVRSSVDGAYFIRRFSPSAGGRFDAVAAVGESLNSERDQLQIVGSACGMAVAEI